MNYGLYLSAAGVMTNRYRQDVFSGHLANVNTHGYKPINPVIANRLPESIENPDQFGTAQRMLDQLGGGVLVGPQTVNFKTAPHEVTNDPLHAAITHDDEFFVVRAEHGESGRIETHLTRDGRFNVHADGSLVTASGHKVLDPNDQPIYLPPHMPVSITNHGQIIDENQQAVGTIQVTRVNNPGKALVPASKGTFKFIANDTRQQVENVDLHTGAIERAAVNAVPTLMKLIAASKSAMGNANMIRYHDTLIDRAVNTLGRIA